MKKQGWRKWSLLVGIFAVIMTSPCIAIFSYTFKFIWSGSNSVYWTSAIILMVLVFLCGIGLWNKPQNRKYEY
jgi:hypothetical protein